MGQRTALVTGGGRGIGAAISRRLAADGFAVAVNYVHDETSAQAVVDEIRAAGGTAQAFAADVGDQAAAAELVAATASNLGGPDVLINNAGLNIAGSVRKQSPADWDRVIAVNLSGAFYTTSAALPSMYEKDWGRVIFASSAAASRRAAPGTGAYGAAKAGLVALAKSLAQELARRPITANVVMPGFVETDIIASGGSGAAENLAAHWPMIPAESIASTISFLCSEDAAHVSGEEIGVWNGGPVGV